jgi:hypothetical protein
MLGCSFLPPTAPPLIGMLSSRHAPRPHPCGALVRGAWARPRPPWSSGRRGARGAGELACGAAQRGRRGPAGAQGRGVAAWAIAFELGATRGTATRGHLGATAGVREHMRGGEVWVRRWDQLFRLIARILKKWKMSKKNLPEYI